MSFGILDNCFVNILITTYHYILQIPTLFLL